MGFFDSPMQYGQAYNLPTDYKSGLADILGEGKKYMKLKKLQDFKLFREKELQVLLLKN